MSCGHTCLTEADITHQINASHDRGDVDNREA